MICFAEAVLSRASAPLFVLSLLIRTYQRPHCWSCEQYWSRMSPIDWCTQQLQCWCLCCFEQIVWNEDQLQNKGLELEIVSSRSMCFFSFPLCVCVSILSLHEWSHSLGLLRLLAGAEKQHALLRQKRLDVNMLVTQEAGHGPPLTVYTAEDIDLGCGLYQEHRKRQQVFILFVSSSVSKHSVFHQHTVYPPLNSYFYLGTFFLQI